MKKIWVEVRRGEIIEATSVRSISAGENLHNDFAESTNLYIRFVGDRKKTCIAFKDTEEKWAGYEKLLAALQEASAPQPAK